MNGFTTLSNLIGAHTDLAIFRKFAPAQVLDLIYRQAELTRLLYQWAQCIRADQDSGDPTRISFDNCFAELANPEHDGERSFRYLKWREISQKLQEYTTRLFQVQRVLSLPPNDGLDAAELRDFLGPGRGYEDFPVGSERFMWAKEVESDLTSLTSTGEKDSIGQWLRGPVIDVIHKIFGAHFKKDIQITDPFLQVTQTLPLKNYSDKVVGNCLASFYAALASMLITIPIFALYFIVNPLVRMGLILIFSFLFSGAMAFVVRAKPAECFQATCAFAAVQIVFVQVSGSTGSS